MDKRLVPAMAILLALQACSTPGLAPAGRHEPVIARNKEFVVLQASQGDDLASLAKQYYGDADKSWLIAEFNNIVSLQPGQIVTVPLHPRSLGITAEGFQTIPILCYHRFGNTRSKLVVSPVAFEAQMAWLAHNGYQVIPLQKLTGFLQGSEPLPRKTVVLTFDDGYRSFYDMAYPILKKYGFPGTVFLYSDFVGAADALTWPQMQEMIASGLIEVQPHSKTHGNLAVRVPRETEAQYRERLKLEVDIPVNVIQNKLGLKSLSYAFPYGDTNESVTSQLVRRNVKLGLTVTPGGNGFFAYPYMLRRSMVFGEDDLAVFKSRLMTFTAFGH